MRSIHLKDSTPWQDIRRGLHNLIRSWATRASIRGILWNPVVKWDHRMSAAGRGRYLLPTLNGRRPELFDANEFLTVFGWGVMWGFERERFTREDGRVAERYRVRTGFERAPRARRWGWIEPNDQRGKRAASKRN